MTATWSSSGRRARRTQAGLNMALTPVSRPGPVLVAWRWRYELAMLAGLPTALVLAGRTIGAGWELTGLGVLLAAVSCCPPARRLMAARAWCVITPHRVRTGCAQAWIHSRSGKVPAVLSTSPACYGERVQLWCHAGTNAADLAGASDVLAAACWASAVQVSRHPRFAHLVTLDVIRHPLDSPPGQLADLDWPATAELDDAGPDDHVVPLTDPI